MSRGTIDPFETKDTRVNDLGNIESLGFTLPSPAYLAGAVLFGIVGYAAWRYGKKNSRPYAKWIGLTLMLYPYLVSDTWLMYAVGTGLCAGLYFLRK